MSRRPPADRGADEREVDDRDVEVAATSGSGEADGVRDVPGPGQGAAGVVALAAALRQAGVAVGTGQLIACQRAVTIVGDALADRYWAARTTLVNDPADLPSFDRVFRRLAAASLDDQRLPAPPAPDEPAEATAASDRSSDGAPSAAGEEVAMAGLIASERERLRHRRFDQASDEELAAIDAILQRLPVAVPHRTSRRTRPGRRGELDLGRSLERALATDGELLDRAWRQRTTTPRRLVVLLDVSGSMAAYARASLRFAVAARRAADRDAAHRVEVFAFGTRLTRLSDHLAARDPDAAIATAAARVVDWDGGTRIGASLDELVRVWGRRGVLRGAVAVIVSDGLERGDPDQLGQAVARLRRQLHRLVWVNPLAGDARYQPTQRGMAAALPHVDRFLPGHDLASLESLSEVLAALR